MNRSELQIRIDEIADDFLKERREGRQPKINDFIQDNSDIADPLREFLKMILMVDDCAAESEFIGLETRSRDSDPDTFPEIPDYEIIREVGRGGMGIVYEAQQLSLDRTVALKLLPASLFSHPQAPERFELEAKSAAKLHHSNIVPVFDVGRQEKNRFYTMQFIEGQSLDHVITSIRKLKNGSSTNQQTAALSETAKMGLSSTAAGRKPFYRNVAKIGQHVASALDYAHKNGVVHRDIKPANLMLDPDGEVWIMDFGLAKTEESDLTQTGDVVGTLRYMSPERFKGHCDSSSDIYSLGMTIYELLSQRTAFGESNRLELIESIKSQEPEALRKTDKQIPRDLETIVEKAICKDPRRRYATAGELSEDLNRFINGQPIFARRVGATERLWLWAKKHKALAASLSALATLLTLTSLGSIVAAFYFSDLADRNLDLSQVNIAKTAEANSARKDALAKKEQAESLAKRSADALHVFTGAFLSASPEKNPDTRAGMKATKVLSNALASMKDSELDAAGQQELLESLGGALAHLGDYKAAIEADQLRLDKLEDLFGTREPQFPGGVHVAEQVPNVDWILETKAHLAEMYGLEGDYEKCLKLCLANHKFTLAECLPTDRRSIDATGYLGNAYIKMENWEEALPWLEAAVAMSSETFGEDYSLGPTLRNNLAICLAATGDFDRSIPILELELENRREENSNWMSVASNLADAYNESGQQERAIGLLVETIAAYKIRFGDDHPDTINAMNSLGACYWKQRRFELSVPLYRDVVAASEKKLGRKNPLTQLAVVNLGVNLLSGGDPKEAATFLEEAFEGGDKTTIQYLLIAYCLTEDTKKFEAFVESELDGDLAPVAAIYGNYSRHFRKNSDFKAAIKIAEAEIEIRESMPNTWQLDFAYGSLGELHAEDGNLEEAIELIDDSSKALENRISELPQAHLNFIIAQPVHTLVKALQKDGSKKDIEKWKAKANQLNARYKVAQ